MVDRKKHVFLPLYDSEARPAGTFVFIFNESSKHAVEHDISFIDNRSFSCLEEAHCVTYMNEIPQGGNALEPSPPDQPVLEPGQKHRVSQKKKL